jgi:hypothetical protein
MKVITTTAYFKNITYYLQNVNGTFYTDYYATEIYEAWAQKHEIPEAEMQHNKDLLRVSAMLHDVGKVGISDAILKKPGKLTEEEYEKMKKDEENKKRGGTPTGEPPLFLFFVV